MSRVLILVITILTLSTLHAQEPLKLGISCPLTGVGGEYGEAVRNGFQLARKEDQPSISYHFEDNQYDAKQTLTGLNSLSHQGIDLLFLWGENPLSAAAEVIERKKIPTVAMSFDHRPLKGKNYIIGGINSALDYTKVVAKHIKKLKYKNIGMFKTNDPYFDAIEQALRGSLESEKLSIIADFDPSTTDFKTSLTKTRKNNYDVLAVYLYPGQVSTFYRQAKQLDIKIPSFGTDIFDSDAEIQDAQGGMEGAFYPTLYVPDEFREIYLKEYGYERQLPFAYHAYIVAKIIHYHSQKLSLAKSQLDRVKILRKIPKESIFSNLSQESDEPYYNFKIALKKIRNNKRTLISDYD